MSNNGWSTISDYFNPLETAVRVQQLDEEMSQRRLRAMAVREQEATQKYNEEAQKYMQNIIQGMTPTPPGGGMPPAQSPMPVSLSSQVMTPTMPPSSPTVPKSTPSGVIPGDSEPEGMPTMGGAMSEAAQEMASGQQMVNTILPKLQQALKAYKNDPEQGEIIDKIGQMHANNKKMQAAFPGSLKRDESGKVHIKTTRILTREQLDKMGYDYKPGSYDFDIDPITNSLRSFRPTVSSLTDDKLSPENRLIREMLKEKLGREPNASEIYNEERKTKIEDARATGESRYAPLLKGRGGNYLDTETGHFGFANVNKLNADSARFVSDKDPNFRAWQQNVNYARMNANYVNTIDRYSKMATDIMTKYGLNQDPKFANYAIQDVMKLRGMGSGEVAALRQILAGLKQEITKVESGALGISGAHVETAKQFDQTINPNMPIKDLLIVFDWAKKAGRERLAAINQETEQLKAGAMGIKAPVEEKAVIERRTINGRTLIKYSDGSIGEEK
jgi:hypothetical protein